MAKISKHEAMRLLGSLKMVSHNVSQGAVPAQMTRATLISLTPLTFRITEQLKLHDQMIVIPKYKVFIEEDIGKHYVFFKNAGGQTYYYMYEASSPQGSNGEPYHFAGRSESTITGASLHGACSCGGTVLVTHGEIHSEEIRKMTHERRVE